LEPFAFIPVVIKFHTHARITKNETNLNIEMQLSVFKKEA
jgi:hypothetical protein